MRNFKRWNDELPAADSLNLLREFARSHAEEAGPFSKDLCRLIKDGDYTQLCDYELDYTLPGLTAFAVYSARQALSFFTKLEGLELPGVDKRKVSQRKFLEAELACSDTNNFVKAVRLGSVMMRPEVGAVIHRATQLIAKVLGDTPNLSELDYRFGPGATRGVRKSDASCLAKVEEDVSCSKELFQISPLILAELPHLTELHSDQYRVDEDMVEWERVTIRIAYARLAFVPKNAKTLRSVATEPGLNVLYQLAVGSVIAERLAAFGVDLTDQTVNQRRALLGSLTGALATLDLSSASDTIAIEIVALLLPLHWFYVLSRGRTGQVDVPSYGVIELAKFSSMGNGFTFPLETLIFWALAASCCKVKTDATVYGDDIVVPTEDAPLVREVLGVCGFTVNEMKSYTTGPFRESCGKDYFGGIDVRPYYQKKWVSAQSLFVLHNFYVRRGDTRLAGNVLNHIPNTLRVYGPDGYGDGCLVGEYPTTRPDKYHQRGFSGGFFLAYTPVRLHDDGGLSDEAKYVAFLYQTTRSKGASEAICRSRPLSADVRDFLKRIGAVDPTRVPIAPMPAPSYSDESRFGLPGVEDYKKTKIYTLGG